MKTFLLIFPLLAAPTFVQAQPATTPPLDAATPPVSSAPTLANATSSALPDARPVLNGPLSLRDALAFAQLNSPVVRGAQAEVQIAQAQIHAAQANRKLSVSATTFLTGGSEFGPIYNTPNGVMPQNLFAVPRGPFFNQNVMLMLPLSTGGRLEALVRQAQLQRGASEFDLQATRLDLALEVRNSYRQALLMREMLNVAQERQNATAERLRLDRAALAAGRAPQLYVLRDEAENADAQQEVTNAQRDLDISLLTLRAVLGARPDSRFDLADALEVASETAPNGDLLSLARGQRPELQAARQRLQAAQQGQSATRGMSRPQVALMAMGDLGRASRSGSGFGGGTSLGVVAGVPLFDGGARRAEREQSSAETARAQADLDRLTLNVERDVQSAQLSQDAATQNIATANAAVASAQESYRVAGLRLEAGRATNAEVLDALAALTRARANRARALYQAQSARDQLSRAVGIVEIENGVAK